MRLTFESDCQMCVCAGCSVFRAVVLADYKNRENGGEMFASQQRKQTMVISSEGV